MHAQYYFVTTKKGLMSVALPESARRVITVLNVKRGPAVCTFHFVCEAVQQAPGI
jgi:hypothetical protein